MDFNAQKISDIYSSKLARRYDFSMPHLFVKWKRRAAAAASLKTGDRVLVFCCGTGLDFEPIHDAVGESGQIVGVDFSKEMLAQAARKVEKNGWRNVELIEADITDFHKALEEPADAGFCTLGLSIIPDFQKAYDNLLSNVTEGGRIIVGDMQLASGPRALFNPLTLLMSRRYGGTREGHENSRLLRERMTRELTNVTQETFFWGAYYYCIGTKPPLASAT